MGYPWQDAIFVQDLELARSELVEETIDIRRDLELDFCEGRVTYLGVSRRDAVITSARTIGEGFTIGSSEDPNQATIRWRQGWGETQHPRRRKVGKKCFTTHRIICV